MSQNSRANRIEAILRAAFQPVEFELVDDSARHAGHAGAAPGGETHYTLRMVAAAFNGQSRVARSRAVYGLLDDEFRGGLHALAMTLSAPDDAL
jgi:BolA family transcriptional regulator, general stress-responsive regulator